jgi:hypothetical protein
MNPSNFLSKINHFFYYDIFRHFRRLFSRVHNLIRWFPVIWKDNDWDGWYIYEILKFKIGNQSRYIGGHNRHTRAREDARNMLLCVRLIEKIQDDYYDTEFFNYYITDLEFVRSKDNPGSYNIEEKLIQDNLEEYFKKYPRVYNQVVSEGKHTESKRIAMEISYRNQQRAKKLLFKVIEENIDRWWD